MRKKLLIIHPVIAPYRVDFFNALYDNFDCKVILWLRNLASQKFDYSEIEKEFHFTPLYMLKRYGKLKLPRGLMKEIRSFTPDIILCSELNPITIEAILYSKILNRRCKVATIIDDSYDMAMGGEQFSMKHIIAKKILLPFLDQIICVEPRVEQLFRKKYGTGVTFPIITEDNRFRKKLDSALPISNRYVSDYNLTGKKVLLFVGRLVELKNIQNIIPLFKALNHDDYVFVIVGDGPMESQLKHLADNARNIIFTGRLEGLELIAWYNIAQLSILASNKEAFGAVTNEALLAGCYALVSRKAGSQSLILPGINGDTFDPYDTDEIQSLLKEAFERQTPLTWPLKLRDSKMPATFPNYMENVLSGLRDL